MRSLVIASALALIASQAQAQEPERFKPMSCTSDDGEQWLVDGQYLSTETRYVTDIGVLTLWMDDADGRQWHAVFPGRGKSTLKISNGRFRLVWADGIVSEGVCKTMQYTTPKPFRRGTDRLFARPFRPVVCTITSEGEKGRRYLIDGKHMTALDGHKAQHPLSVHRTVGRDDEWESMQDGVQPGALLIENRRKMMWNPAGTVKVLGNCRDATRRDSSRATSLTYSHR